MITTCKSFFYSSMGLNYDNILANHSEADKNNTLPKGDLKIYKAGIII